MDLGALGIVFPMMNAREQAEAAVRSVRYPPAGDRLWGPFYAPMRWGQSMRQYIDAANRNVLAIMTIEHPDAVRNIDEIMSVPGWTSRSSGQEISQCRSESPVSSTTRHSRAAVTEAEAGILRSKVPLGGVARTPDQARDMLERGYRAIVFGFDWMLLHDATARFLEEVRGRGA